MSAHNRKTPACGAFRGPAIQLVNEPRSLCARRRKENPIIFFGDMCGEENTSQAASVEFVRRRRTNYARSRLQNPLSKSNTF